MHVNASTSRQGNNHEARRGKAVKHRGEAASFVPRGEASASRHTYTTLGIPDFLMAFHCNFGDMLHGFFTNRINALKI
jgi:hypothetical protein